MYLGRRFENGPLCAKAKGSNPNGYYLINTNGGGGGVAGAGEVGIRLGQRASGIHDTDTVPPRLPKKALTRWPKINLPLHDIAATNIGC